jgi:hypothetical protein
MGTLTARDLAKHGEAPPEDLCPAAIALARRVQALPAGSVYSIIVNKQGKTSFTYAVDKMGKIEAAREDTEH